MLRDRPNFIRTYIVSVFIIGNRINVLYRRLGLVQLCSCIEITLISNCILYKFQFHFGFCCLKHLSCSSKGQTSFISFYFGDFQDNPVSLPVPIFENF